MKKGFCLSCWRGVYFDSWPWLLLHYWLFAFMKLMIKCTVFRENLPAVLPQPHRAVWAAEEARPGCSVPDSPLPRQNFTQVRPTSPGFLVWIDFFNSKHVATHILCSLFVVVLHWLPSWQTTAMVEKKKERTTGQLPWFWTSSALLRLWSQQFDCFLSSGGLPWQLRSLTQRAVTSAALVSGQPLCFIYSPFYHIKLCEYTRNIPV